MFYFEYLKAGVHSQPTWTMNGTLSIMNMQVVNWKACGSTTQLVIVHLGFFLGTPQLAGSTKRMHLLGPPLALYLSTNRNMIVSQCTRVLFTHAKKVSAETHRLQRLNTDLRVHHLSAMRRVAGAGTDTQTSASGILLQAALELFSAPRQACVIEAKPGYMYV